MRRLLLIVAICAPQIAIAEQYICMAEQATGFIHKNNAWVGGTLVGDEKYLVSFEKKSVGIFGEADPIHTNCEFRRAAGKLLFRCDEGLGDFYMSSDTMKYQRSVPWLDYVLDATKGTPHIEIGTCAKF